MKKKFTMLFAALLACVGVMKAEVNSELQDKAIEIGNAVTEVTDGWYILNNVGRGNYVSEETTAMKMRATSNVANGQKASDKAGYLFKITKVSDGKYNIQSGNGLYFSLGWNSSAISAEPVNYEISLIGESTNNYCLFDIDHTYAADGQETGSNFVGWSESKPTKAGGNDSYRLLPVTLQEPAPVDRTILNTAIADAKTALAAAGYTFEVGEAVALQIENNTAAGYLSVSHPACDDDVLANAIDKDGEGNANRGTLYHSSWVAAKADPYMQVDLGEGESLSAFVLNYSTRQSGNNAAPFAMTVSGSNNGEDFAIIAELSKDDILNALPSANAKEFTSVIAANEAYRYLRFTVTSSPNGNNSFGVANFAIKKVAVTGEKTGLAMRCATIYKAVLDAESVTSIWQEDIDNAAAYLNGVVAAIATSASPIEFTTDVENPVCYLIKSGRFEQGWTNPYWAFSENGVVITEYADEAALAKDINAYWYFVEDENTGLLKLYPAEQENAMGYKAVSDGANKLTNNPAECVGVWYQLVVKDGDHPYALKPYGYNNYVSNHSGRNNKMGFYNDVNDKGTRFALEQKDAPSGYANLNVAITEAQAYKSGENIGDYTQESIEGLATVIAAALAVYENENSTEEDYLAQTEALAEAIANLTIVLPDFNKFYIFDCNYENRKLHINADNKLNWAANGFDITNSRAVFQFEAGSKPNSVKIKSVHTQSYMNAISNNTHITFGETGADITIEKSSYAEGAVTFTTDGIRGIHANSNPVIGYTNEAGSNHYRLVEVTEFKHTLTIDEYDYMTLMLGFNAEVPEGVTAYKVTGTEGKELVMESVGNVIPANEPVIVYAEVDAEGTMAAEFAYTTAAATKSNDNLLKGSLVDNSAAAPTAGYDAYVMALSGAEVVMSKAKLNEGTFKNRANKAYLEIAQEVAAGAAMFSFSRGGEDEETTGIESVELNGEVVIYDLAGRRVEKMEKGIYIVNGKKVVK